jgi:hypothetical protein
MSSDDASQSIAADLEQLKQESRATPLSYPVERVIQLADSGKITPEQSREWIAMLRSILQEFKNDKPLSDLIPSTPAGNFVQPGWNPGTVNQAQGSIINFVFQDVREQIAKDDPNLHVPVILLTMTDAEARSLDSGEAFEGYPDDARADFEELRALLEKNDLSSWVQNYQPNPEDWRPFRNNADTIGQLVRNSLKSVTGFKKTLVPQFYTIQQLVEDGERKTLRMLRTEGCVVIMDAISIHHPRIQRSYRRSLLDAYPNTIVMRIAPLYAMFDLVYHLILFAEKNTDLEFYKRLTSDSDDNCREASRVHELQNWLQAKIPTLLPKNERDTGDHRDYAFKP